MFFFTCGLARKMSISHRLRFVQTLAAQSPVVSGSLPYHYPASFARTATGWVYIFTGLNAPLKWNGTAYSAVTVGNPAPATAPAIAASGSGSITGTYTAYLRFLDSEGNPSNLSPISNTLTAAHAGKITYTAVALPTDVKAVRRQLLRNTSGQTSTYYVDVDTTDLSATTFSSTLTDTLLGAGLSVPLFDSDGASLANRYHLPPDDKPIVISYQGRMWAMGDISYAEGMVEVTYGSATVQGVGTRWNSVMANRFLYIVGAAKAYQISSVSESLQQLTLAETYKGQTDNFGVYSIRSPPAIRNLVYFSEADVVDAWPTANSLSFEETGDEVTAGISADSFLYIVQRRHTHRLSYRVLPSTDGGVFLASYRGCVNHRSWIMADGNVYLMDEQGIYVFAGSRDPESISTPIQDIFWFENSPVAARINWNAIRWIHAVHHKEESTIRWFVPLCGQYLPRHALAFNYGNKSWSIEEYPYPVGASCVMENDTARPIVGVSAKRIMALGVGTLDGPNLANGTARGTATSATGLTLTDSNASFPASGVVGSPVAIVAGTGKGQSRMVSALASGKMTVTQPWLTMPDTTSQYQVGAIGWSWRSGWFNWLPEETQNVRRAELTFEPMSTPSTLDVRVYYDHAAMPKTWGLTWPTTVLDSSGVKQVKGDADMVVDLTDAMGFAQLRLDSGQEYFTHDGSWVALDLRGFSSESLQRIYGIDVEGAKK